MFREKLTRWYDRAKRDLPWRRTNDPYAIWISEIMLQQTRVAAVIPYYERFLECFPDVAALARAPESELLAMWSGLGYYSRARNLQKAAAGIAASGEFPCDYATLLQLPGVGEYTAAAVASMAFGQPHAVVDGNVRRVIARLLNDGSADAQSWAARLLDRRDPGRWNQAMMELGATLCLPRAPLCGECPMAARCVARRAGTQEELPPRKSKRETEHLERTLLLIERRGRILLTPSQRVPGFWDLPEPFQGVSMGATLGEFTHTITHRRYRFTVRAAQAAAMPKICRWSSDSLPMSTTVVKALRIAYNSPLGGSQYAQSGSRRVSYRHPFSSRE